VRDDPVLDPRGVPDDLVYAHVVSLGRFANCLDDVDVLAARVPVEGVEDLDFCGVGGRVVDELGKLG
jgi:hypothetical protein